MGNTKKIHLKRNRGRFSVPIENNGDRLYFLSDTKCGRTKEVCPHYFARVLDPLQECP
jgi:hypothetical protein